jgi:hypothetical protein
MGFHDEIGDWLAESAATNLDRALGILGAKPGPGIDINVHPATEPMNDTWILLGQTKAGRAFVSKFWADPVIHNNKQLLAFKRQCDDWSLKYHIYIKFESLEKEHD